MKRKRKLLSKAERNRRISDGLKLAWARRRMEKLLASKKP